MGHYDSCYEADSRDKSIKRHEELDTEIKKVLNELNIDEKKLLIKFAKNIDAFNLVFNMFK